MRFLWRSAALFLVLPASVAGAQPSTDVAGNLSVASSTGVQTSLAGGFGSTATTATGSIAAGASVGGSTQIRAGAGVETAIALAPGASATAEVGTIDGGAHVAGSANLNASAGSLTAVTLFPGSSTCVAVGSVGPGGYGSVATGAAAGGVLVMDVGWLIHSHVDIGSRGRPC